MIRTKALGDMVAFYIYILGDTGLISSTVGRYYLGRLRLVLEGHTKSKLEGVTQASVSLSPPRAAGVAALICQGADEKEEVPRGFAKGVVLLSGSTWMIS